LPTPGERLPSFEGTDDVIDNGTYIPLAILSFAIEYKFFALNAPVYLRDPDGNGIESYTERPRDEWPTTPEGEIDRQTLPLDLDDLLKEL